MGTGSVDMVLSNNAALLMVGVVLTTCEAVSKGKNKFEALHQLNLLDTANNPYSTWHIPVGLNFLFLDFESKI